VVQVEQYTGVTCVLKIIFQLSYRWPRYWQAGGSPWQCLGQVVGSRSYFTATKYQMLLKWSVRPRMRAFIPGLNLPVSQILPTTDCLLPSAMDYDLGQIIMCSTYFVPSPIDSVGEGVMFSGCPSAALVRPASIRPDRIAPIDDVIRFWRARLKGRGHSRPSRWRRHPRRRWSAEVHFLVQWLLTWGACTRRDARFSSSGAKRRPRKFFLFVLILVIQCFVNFHLCFNLSIIISCSHNS